MGVCSVEFLGGGESTPNVETRTGYQGVCKRIADDEEVIHTHTPGIYEKNFRDPVSQLQV